MAEKITTTCVPIEDMDMGMISTNVYIVDDGTGCIVVDPACDAERILAALDGRKVDAIFLTHAHYDHTGAAEALRDATGAPVIISAVDAPYLENEVTGPEASRFSVTCSVDRTIEDGDVLEVGNMKWQVLSTPGHTLGSVCFYLEPEEGQAGAPVLLSGDTLFYGTHGRVDFEESDMEGMRLSLLRLEQLPPETVVLPGHNALTTIAHERGWLRICH